MPATYQPDTAAFTSNLFGSIQADPFLSTRRKNFLASNMLDQQEKIQEQSFKDAQQAQLMELNNVRLEGSRLALEEARRAAQAKRDAVAQAPVAMQTFESILDDPALDPKTKRARINRAAMSFSGAMTYSPELQEKYKYATQAAEPDAAPEDQLTLHQRYSMGLDKYRILKEQSEDAQKLEDKQKAEEEKRFKAELEFLDRIKDIKMGPPANDPYGEAIFNSPNDKELALDVIDRYDPASYDAVAGKSDREIYSAAAQIRRKALRQVSPTAAPTVPKVDDKSRFR
jgi:hypothetical protein